MKRSILLTIAIFLSIATISHASSISIDNTGGTWDDAGTLKTCPNMNLTFDIRYTNTSGLDIGGITNGFRIWTTGGSAITPVSVEMLYPGFEGFFDLVFYVDTFVNGVGDYTIGVGGSKLIGSGLPDGFNEVVLRIKTGGVQEGETICIDSSFYPPSGTWQWAAVTPPSWSGPMCIESANPACLAPEYFTNDVDTITNNCETLSYTFDAYAEFIMFGMKYYIIDGLGTIDINTGEWSYNFLPEDYGTTFDLTIGAYDQCICNYISYTTTVKINNVDTTIDFNDDCASNIADLVYLVAYMFQGGPSPIPLLAADVNGDGTMDISDLVYLVAYMFQGGPPPVS